MIKLLFALLIIGAIFYYGFNGSQKWLGFSQSNDAAKLQVLENGRN